MFGQKNFLTLDKTHVISSNYFAFSYSCLVNIKIMVIENSQEVSPWSSIDLFVGGAPRLAWMTYYE